MEKRIKDAEPQELEDFSGLTKPLLDFIRTNWNVEGIEPKDYQEFMEDYEDGKGMGDEKYELPFDGLLDTHHAKPPFPVLMTTPNVAYSANEQGRDPLQTMVGCLVAYGMAVGEARAKKEEIERLKMAFKVVTDFMSDLAKGEHGANEDIIEHAEIKLSLLEFYLKG